MERARSLASGPTDGFVVRSPRETDAIGSALRGAYGRRMDVPDDMAGMLARLDSFTRPR